MITLHSRDLQYSLAEREVYLRSLGPLKENCILLHTCNRTELYAGEGEVPIEIARHLFRVVCGLESALPGETAIQGQIKEAYEAARGKRELSASLHRLFQHALRVGKRVRTETGVSKGAMTHSKAVLEILRQDNVNLSSSQIVVIGVNNMNRSVVKYLVEHGSRTVFVANRTFERARALSAEFGCDAIRFSGLPEKLITADILISSTSAPHLIVTKEDFIPQKPIVIFDLAVPRDIDPAITGISGVTLYNIEDIERRIDGNRNCRIGEIHKAERIIDEGIHSFYEKN
jgi:glutamyl-tRNA reductase